MWTFLAALTAAAAAGGFTGLVIQDFGSAEANNRLQKAYKNFKNSTKGTEAENIDIEQMFGYLRAGGIITESDYSRYLNDYKDFEKQLADKDDEEIWRFFQSGKKMNEAIEMYELLAEHYPDFQKATSFSLQEVLNQSGIKVNNAALPPYLQVNADPTFEEAEPMKLWTTQELADLHDLNIDANYYYDAIKQGTEANKNLAMFKADQAINAAGTNDTVDRNTYLNNIRGVKSDAIAKGATMGAQAANEILANRNAVSSAISKQNDVINNAYNSVLSSVRADADARLSATDYTNSLIKSLANDINTLYANDAIRYGQDMLSAAERYGADMDVINAQRAANASMWSNYQVGQANINAANSTLNDYAFMFDNVLMPKNDYNMTQSFLDLFDYVKQNQTGYGRFATMQNEANKQ